MLDVFTGCGLDRAEAMRRALASDQGRAQVEAEFRALADQRGHTPQVIDQVWEMVAAFGAFGFCKAHGVAFAASTYQSAYLKRHHPAAFTAGIMAHDPGMYPRRVLLQDARRMGVPVLGLDVNASHTTWRVERIDQAGLIRWGLRPPLVDVTHLTDRDVDQLLTHRPVTDLADLLARTDLSREGLDDLILAGGLDTLTGGRAHRRSALLHAHAEDLARLAAHHRLTLAQSLHQLEEGAPVTVAGRRVSVQTPPTRSGARVVFAPLEDRTGLVDLALFGSAQQRSAAAVFAGGVLLARGRIRRAAPGALPTVDATEVRPLEHIVDRHGESE
ncbi:helix-hairpin-helix domain-containing protein [Nocardiopsis quinghaiensis]|uniref:helix-hairpin-helix domain-containing protein n=1 Tax=Nocardiopsis quinghaiensis TaxID=464995 RepID=UPI0021DF615E|nr:OB-fold nucleic acid binding domain-containing protein [Nocardiopsis quinghaiensis]